MILINKYTNKLQTNVNKYLAKKSSPITKPGYVDETTQERETDFFKQEDEIVVIKRK